jgi:hypothetical protein
VASSLRFDVTKNCWPIRTLQLNCKHFDGVNFVAWLITALVIMAQYTYDEQGVTFNYFVLSVLALFLIPLTLQWIYQTFKDAKGNRS